MIALFVCNDIFAQQQKSIKKSKNIEEVTFVTSIECKNCVKKVEANIPYEKGVKDLKVDLESRSVTIKFDPSKTDSNKLAEAIKKLGFTADVKKCDEKCDGKCEGGCNGECHGNCQEVKKEADKEKK